jgi:hypothetical protein
MRARGIMARAGKGSVDATLREKGSFERFRLP